VSRRIPRSTPKANEEWEPWATAFVGKAEARYDNGPKNQQFWLPTNQDKRAFGDGRGADFHVVDEESEWVSFDHRPAILNDGRSLPGERHQHFHTRWVDNYWQGRGVFGPDRNGPPPKVICQFYGSDKAVYLECVTKKSAEACAITLAKRLHADPVFTNSWDKLAKLPVEDRKGLVKIIYQIYIKRLIQTNSVYQIDNCKGVIMAVMVPGYGNGVAPGHGIFAEAKRGHEYIADAPEDVLRLSHLKARRMHGKKYIYIWAIAVDPELNEAHQRDLLLALVHWVLAAANREDLPVVVEATDPAQIMLWEGFGFRRVENMEVYRGNERQVWACMVRPQTSYTGAPLDDGGFMTTVGNCGGRCSQRAIDTREPVRFCGAEPERTPVELNDRLHAGTETFTVEPRTGSGVFLRSRLTPKGLTEAVETHPQYRTVNSTHYMV